MEQNHKNKHRGLKTTAVIALLAVALLADSRYRLVNTHLELSYDNLPDGFDKYKIVQLSDLHMMEYGDNNYKITEIVSAENPDIIVLTGDFINRRSKEEYGGQTAKVRPFFEELVKIAPCYFISGNHEWASGELVKFTEMLKEVGINYLRNEFVILEKGEDQILLAGVEDENGFADQIKPDELVESIRNDYPEEFMVFLGHRNSWLQKYPDLPVDLIFAGHAHGGVVRLPFVGGVLGTERNLFPEYDGGLYNEGNYDMVLSRGLGGNEIIPRVLNNPEIITVELRKIF